MKRFMQTFLCAFRALLYDPVRFRKRRRFASMSFYLSIFVSLVSLIPFKFQQVKGSRLRFEV